MERYESPVDRAIREAQERGEFDNLPGTGKPLKGIGGPDDPDWWLKGLMAREGLDMTDALPPAVALRKEAATFPESLRDLRSEESVRAVLEDFNRRVRHDRLRPAVGPFPPLIARTVDVDALVAQWRDLRARRQAQAGVTAGEPETCAPPGRAGRRGWWARLRRRR